MKTYQEFTSTTSASTLTEATLTSEVIKANKGREGKPMISLVDGEEVRVASVKVEALVVEVNS